MSFTYCNIRLAGYIGMGSPIMHCMVFIARYIDLFALPRTNIYNTSMKLYLLSGSLITLFTLLRRHGPFSKQQQQTTLWHVLLTAAPCLLLACLAHYGGSFKWMEIAWAFSMYLAAFADIPQLVEYDRMETKDRLLTAYLVLCFYFRALYIPHWVLRYFDEGRVDPIATVSGVTQTTIYIFYGLLIVLHHSRRQATRAALDAEVQVDDVSSPGKVPIEEKVAIPVETAPATAV
ncbi:hypothetical protein GLOTRDRAFT_122773 [Gloeophyllum trabeum ATCC 11539]|uniref:ER lumen protein retaining receptor n=1 Tax=Gloeophyllum trabeum (strain ATCC 11539 / FP-39264 / Madison 617) TaxID=670483 RepID=S7PX25_GLOTA|nr:uncharacterized protein GLOTRDRAFT_122773 [Gloeophyllum trabeum ATCC 11539]EPQ52033.1 hypothetical protein GLOTRDRAFT_122773 [Gloeophyllum trabeum ATCC 11539]